jgi:hypothetical protein
MLMMDRWKVNKGLEQVWSKQPYGFLKQNVVRTALFDSNGHNKMDSGTIKHTVNCYGVGLY